MSIVLSPTLVVFATSDEASSDNVDNNNDDWNESCKDAGYDHGRDASFSQDTHDHCGDETGGDEAYYDGFIDGCMSVEGNTRDMCESATYA